MARGKKLTQEDAEQIFIDGGGTFDDIYRGIQHNYNYTCSCGNKGKINIHTFRIGGRCKECGYKKLQLRNPIKPSKEQLQEDMNTLPWTEIGKKYGVSDKVSRRWAKNYNLNIKNKPRIVVNINYNPTKLTQEYIENSFIDGGGTFDDIYYGSHRRYNYTCSCGNKGKIRTYEFINRGVRCIECFKRSKNRTHPINEYSFIKNEIEKFGFKLLSEKYINSKTKLKIQCSVGHIYETTWGTFKKTIHKCNACFRQFNTKENHYKWKTDRGRIIRAKYLSFNHRHHEILKDDVNYNNYINYKTQNKGKNIYTIDHIFPRIAFIDNDLDNIYDKEIIKKICNVRENLKIITQKENNKKSCKYNQDEFITWFKSRPEYPELERLREEALVKEYINSR